MVYYNIIYISTQWLQSLSYLSINGHLITSYLRFIVTWYYCKHPFSHDTAIMFHVLSNTIFLIFVPRPSLSLMYFHLISTIYHAVILRFAMAFTKIKSTFLSEKYKTIFILNTKIVFLSVDFGPCSEDDFCSYFY